MSNLRQQNASSANYKAEASDFQFLSFLGSGNFGTTSRERNKANGLSVAIKSVMSLYIERKISNKINLVRNLSHPAISTLQHVIFPGGSCLNHYRFVSEFLDKGSLANLYVNMPFSKFRQFWTQQKKASIAFNIAVAMQYLHHCGFIHGFLSSSNVLFDKNSQLKINDFWYTLFLPDKSQKFLSGAKALYSAPERFGMRPLTNKVDVFSYGMILFELVYEFPLNQKDVILQHQILSMAYSKENRRPDISPPLHRLIFKCLSINPEDRPSFDYIIANFFNDQDPLFSGVNFIYHPTNCLYLLKNNIYQMSRINLYDTGDIPITLNNAESIKQFAESHNNAKALFIYGKLTNNLVYVKVAADKGNKSAQFYYACQIRELCKQNYLKENNLVDDSSIDEKKIEQIIMSNKTVFNEILKYLKMSADQNYVKALELYSEYTEDEEEKLSYLKKAADLGSIKSQIQYAKLTHCYYYLIMAAHKHNSEALFLLAQCEEKGEKPHFDTESASIPITERFSITDAYKYLEEKTSKVIFKDLSSAIDHYDEAAILNNLDAISRLETIGNTGSKLVSKAEMIFKQNDPEKTDSLVLYALMILSGCFNVKKNVQEAARILRLAAEVTDNPDAQYQLYEIYHVYSNTKEINMESEEAINFLKKAADHGHVKASVAYAKCLLDKSVNNSRIYFHRISESLNDNYNIDDDSYLQSDSDSLISSSTSYDDKEFDNIMRLSPKETISHSITTDNKLDISNVENRKCITENSNEEHTIKDFFYYFRYAANMGDIEAILLYINSIQKFHEIKDIIFEIGIYYKLAANRGDYYCQFHYGQMLEVGQGVEEEDINEALYYYKLAAKQGSPSAMLSIAHIYEGHGMDQYETNKKFLIAGVHGEAQAMNILGDKYAKGLGAEINWQKALLYFQIAAFLGDHEAQSKYGYYLTLYNHENDELVNEGISFMILSLSHNYNFFENNYYNLIDDSSESDNESFFEEQLDNSVMVAQWLAFLYLNKKLKIYDLNEAAICLKEAIHLGGDESLFYLGDVYKSMGKISKAESIYLLGQQKGITKCFSKAAKIYERDKNNIIKAAQLYEAAGVDNPIYFLHAAKLYDKILNEKSCFKFQRNPKQVSDDLKIGVLELQNKLYELYSKAVVADDSKFWAHYRMGQILIDSMKQRDAQLGITLLQESANAKNSYAIYEIAKFIKRIISQNQSKDYIFNIIKSIIRNQSQSQYQNIIDIIDPNEINQFGTNLVHSLIKKSAKLGNSKAKVEYSNYLIHSNPNKALKLLHESIKQNEPSAFMKLGDLYENGIIVPQNISNAIYLYIDDDGYLNPIFYARRSLLLKEKKFNDVLEPSNENFTSIYDNQEVCLLYNSILQSNDIKLNLQKLKSMSIHGNLFAGRALGQIYAGCENVPRDIGLAIKYFRYTSNLINHSTDVSTESLTCKLSMLLVENGMIDSALEYLSLLKSDQAKLLNAMLKYNKSSIISGVEINSLYSSKDYFASDENHILSKNIPLKSFNREELSQILNYENNKLCNNPYAMYNKGIIMAQDYASQEKIENGLFLMNDTINEINDPAILYSYAETLINLDKNDPVALKYLEEAATQGCIKAIRLISNLYRESNPKLVSHYIEIGSSLGDHFSMFWRAKELIEQNNILDAKSLLKVVSQSNGNASYLLGKVYEEEKKYQKAIMYYDKSSCMGIHSSLLRIAYLHHLNGNIEKSFLFNQKAFELGIEGSKQFNCINQDFLEYLSQLPGPDDSLCSIRQSDFEI